MPKLWAFILSWTDFYFGGCVQWELRGIGKGANAGCWSMTMKIKVVLSPYQTFILHKINFLFSIEKQKNRRVLQQKPECGVWFASSIICTVCYTRMNPYDRNIQDDLGKICRKAGTNKKEKWQEWSSCLQYTVIQQCTVLIHYRPEDQSYTASIIVCSI